jgi:hypothetical protein
MDEKIRKVKKHVDKSFNKLIKEDKKRDKVVERAHKVLSGKHSARGR